MNIAWMTSVVNSSFIDDDNDDIQKDLKTNVVVAFNI